MGKKTMNTEPSTCPIIDETLVNKILHLFSFGIPKGLGKPKEGEMCIEAIICFALGLPHSDKPLTCVDADANIDKIRLNDCDWSSNSARAKGMKYIGIAQLGSAKLEKGIYAKQMKLNSVRRILPYLIQKHYDNLEVKDVKLLEYKAKFESLTVLDDLLWKEFYYYYNNYNYYYNNYYYYNYYGDEFLLLIADTILQTFKELKTEGCDYLHLIK